MKVDALWITDPKKIEIQSIEVPDPPYGQIQVEVKACGICMGDQALYKSADASHTHPFRFGHEPSGVVLKVGSGVKGFKPGDNVACIGEISMAQVINLPAENSVVISETVDDYATWIIEPIVCVITSVACVPLAPADDIVLIGAGYMGLLKIQALSKTLRGRLTVFDLDDRMLELARKFGADETYNANSDEGQNAIKKIVENGGVPLVIECSGAIAGFETANRCIQQSGTLELFGWQRGICSFDGTPWHMGGIKVFNTAPFIDRNYISRIGQAKKLIEQGVFDQKELITHRINYKQANEAFEIATQRIDGYIKGVITF